ncbi:MAG: PorT family protein [Cyclobacteriaceae bacterium]|nr:PorT family protein [Cyclobacteriaceae bacterium]
MLKQIKIYGILLPLLFLMTIIPLKAQDAGAVTAPAVPGARPDIPGMLGLEFGWLLAPDFPSIMDLNFIGSFILTPYYKFDIHITHSNFSVHPGISLSSGKFSFDENITLVSRPTTDGYDTDLIGLDTLFSLATIKKSKLNTVYFEIPLEITYRTKRDYPKQSFKLTVGAKGGVLIDAKTKYIYKQDNQTKKSKQKEKYDLNTWRVMLVGKIGYGSFNLFYNYSLLPIFKNEKGPLGTEAQQMSFGISFDLF